MTLPGIRSHPQAQAELPWAQCGRRRNAKVESMCVVEIVPSATVAAVSREACQKCTLRLRRLAGSLAKSWMSPDRGACLRPTAPPPSISTRRQRRFFPTHRPRGGPPVHMRASRRQEASPPRERTDRLASFLRNHRNDTSRRRPKTAPSHPR